MLTKKVNMYGGYVDSLRTIHDCKCIAEPLIANAEHMK
jgi:hypothetical protein